MTHVIPHILSMLMVMGLFLLEPLLLTPAQAQPGPTCDQSLWKHVYKPQRLMKLKPSCITVTGQVQSHKTEADGDLHIRLKPDPPFVKLLNAKNKGELVVEPICVGTVTQKDAMAACKNFTTQLQIPPDGTRVSVTGSYVLDRKHGWREIHPVTSIAPLP